MQTYNGQCHLGVFTGLNNFSQIVTSEVIFQDMSEVFQSDLCVEFNFKKMADDVDFVFFICTLPSKGMST